MQKKFLPLCLMAAAATFAQSPNHTPQHFELQHGAPCQPIESGDTISITLRPKWLKPPPPDFEERFNSKLLFVKKDSPTPPIPDMWMGQGPKAATFYSNKSEPRPDDFMRITYRLDDSMFHHEGGEFTLRFAQYAFDLLSVVGHTDQKSDAEPVMLEYCVLLKNTIPIPPEQIHGDGIQFAPPRP